MVGFITGAIYARYQNYFLNGSRVEDHSWFGLALKLVVMSKLCLPLDKRMHQAITIYLNNLLHFADAICGPFCMFQQDNASINVANSS